LFTCLLGSGLVIDDLVSVPKVQMSNTHPNTRAAGHSRGPFFYLSTPGARSLYLPLPPVQKTGGAWGEGGDEV